MHHLGLSCGCGGALNSRPSSGVIQSTSAPRTLINVHFEIKQSGRSSRRRPTRKLCGEEDSRPVAPMQHGSSSVQATEASTTGRAGRHDRQHAAGPELNPDNSNRERQGAEGLEGAGGTQSRRGRGRGRGGRRGRGPLHSGAHARGWGRGPTPLAECWWTTLEVSCALPCLLHAAV
jgi:hypothetical protein